MGTNLGMATNSVFWAVTAIRMKYAYFKRYTYVARKKILEICGKILNSYNWMET